MIRPLFLFLLILGNTAAYSDSVFMEAVEIGGIKQWISVRGADTHLPVLLFLHGGPGSSSAYAHPFISELQHHFTVVLWDQRESGFTARLNSSTTPLTLERMESDAVEMINYLRTRFSQDKIYLMGHSWGGFLGMSVAAHRPELVLAYFAVSPMIYQQESEKQSLEWMIKKARTDNNAQALKELGTVRIPFENAEQIYFHRSWLAKDIGTKPPTRSYVNTWSEKWLSLFNDASTINFFKTAPEIKCPVYFFVGGKDYQTYFQLTKDYYESVKADKKALFWFADSGHNLILTEPKKFQKIIIDIVSSEGFKP